MSGEVLEGTEIPGGGGGGGGGIIPNTIHCHHQYDFCIKMGNGVSHFTVYCGGTKCFLLTD